MVGVGAGGGALLPCLPGLGLPRDFPLDVPAQGALPCRFPVDVPGLEELPGQHLSAFIFCRCLAFSSPLYRLIEASGLLMCLCILLASFFLMTAASSRALSSCLTVRPQATLAW